MVSDATRKKLSASAYRRWGNQERRFWSKVDKSGGLDTCWLWTGAKVRGTGYGIVRWDGRSDGAHRASYQAAIGPIPENMQVCHRCDVKLCCNPKHLFLGTQKDNMADMICKGRQATGEALNHLPQQGELNYNAKVTEATVREIRCLYGRGISLADISRKVTVPRENVWSIAHGKSWKHVV